MSDSGILLLDTPVSSTPAAVDVAFTQIKTHTEPTLNKQLGNLSTVPLSASETWHVAVASGVRNVPFLLAVNPGSSVPIIFNVLPPPIVGNLTVPAAMHLARELFQSDTPSSAQITACSEAQVFSGNTFVLVVARAELWKSLKIKYQFVSAARAVINTTPLAVQLVLRGIISMMIVDEADRKKKYTVVAAAVTAALAFLAYQTYKRSKAEKKNS